MAKPKTLDGVVYNKDQLRSIRDSMIELRDGALKQSQFSWAVTLSHTIAILGFYIEELDD